MASPVIKYVLIYPLLYLIRFIDFLIGLLNCKKRKQESKRPKKDAVLSELTNKADTKSPYRSTRAKELVKIDNPNYNIYLAFQECTQKYSNVETLGTREVFRVEDEVQDSGKVFKKFIMGDYKWMKYADILSKVDNISNGLLSLGLKSGDNVVLFSETRAEWLITALACFKINVVVVTQYATLGLPALVFGVNQTDARFIIASGDTLTKVEKIINEIPQITNIIVFADRITDKYIGEFKLKHKKQSVLTIKEVEDLGKSNQVFAYTSSKRDDLAIIMYTSGSTGSPKGF